MKLRQLKLSFLSLPPDQARELVEDIQELRRVSKIKPPKAKPKSSSKAKVKNLIQKLSAEELQSLIEEFN